MTPRLRRRRRARPTLMLTSLLDMFTIILIFLIVSFESEDYDFRLNPDLKLPESTARSAFKPAANVAVTRSGVLVEGFLVAPLTDGRGQAPWYTEGTIPPVVEALERVKALRAGEVSDDGGASIVMLQADEGIDYATLYLVMRSAGLAGFDKYRLAVLKR
ncbi:MAG: biopolymer transporter ExbD [Myxococcales bacterium]|nr:biopolymer transporter ExbD [Myxococcales bacterium]